MIDHKRQIGEEGTFGAHRFQTIGARIGETGARCDELHSEHLFLDAKSTIQYPRT